MERKRKIKVIGSLSFGNEPVKTKFIVFRGFGGGEGKPLICAVIKNKSLSYSLHIPWGDFAALTSRNQ